MNPGKASTVSRRAGEAQALVTAISCGPNRGIVGLKLIDQADSSGGEYFVPFALNNGDSERAHVYAGLSAALDRLRGLKVHRVLIMVDDALLVDELERRVEPPRELFLDYVIVGCKLNEFSRAKVVAAQSSRLETLRAKAANLAATIYQSPLPLATA